jgi:hypothetical protein
MACDITAGRKKTCKGGLAGVAKIYLFNDLEDAFTVVNGVATAINPLLQDVYQYDLVGGGNSLTQSLVGDRNTGTTLNTQTLTVLLNKLTKEDNNQMNKLASGYPRAVVKDKQGNYHIVGYNEGLDFTVAPTTGGAQGDFNGYTLTGTALEGELAPILDTATVLAFLAVVNPNV